MLAIILTLIVAVIRNAPALAPAAVIVVALASKPAMAASSGTSCFIDCTKATHQILKITMLEPILGREHESRLNMEPLLLVDSIYAAARMEAS